MNNTKSSNLHQIKLAQEVIALSTAELKLKNLNASPDPKIYESVTSKIHCFTRYLNSNMCLLDCLLMGMNNHHLSPAQTTQIFCIRKEINEIRITTSAWVDDNTANAILNNVLVTEYQEKIALLILQEDMAADTQIVKDSEEFSKWLSTALE